MSPWKLPVLVAAIAVPTVTAFYLGGPGVGVAVGALAAVAIVAVAVRQRPRGAIGEDATDGNRLLVVAAAAVEGPEAIAAIGELLAAGSGPAEVLVLAPVRIGFLDRWASDLEGARRRAQQSLVITVASLAKAGIEAEARVGDEDIVQAVEDQLGGFAATRVALVSAGPGEDPDAARAAEELAARLSAGFSHLVVSGPAER